MPAISPKVNSWYELKADYGTGHGLIPKGSQLQVTHLPPADEPGHGVYDDEPVLMQFFEESSVTGRVVQRRISVRKRDFPAMFKSGAEPAEYVRWVGVHPS
jgi:hypothetical protein